MVQQCSMAGEVAWCECQYQATEDAFPDAKRKAGLCAESKLYIVSVVEQYEERICRQAQLASSCLADNRSQDCP